MHLVISTSVPLCELTDRIKVNVQVKLKLRTTMALRTKVNQNNRCVFRQQPPVLSEKVWTLMPTTSGSCGRL